MKNKTKPARPGQRDIVIDFLFLDLKTCTRCVGTNENLERALVSVEEVLQMTGASLRVNKILIDSPEKARAHRFLTSPTIRVNERDIALETKESKCDSCTDLCGCSEGTDCRVWVYRGEEYNAAPVAMIVEAVLQEVFRAPLPQEENTDYEEVPENLQRFFAGATSHVEEENAMCCSSAKQESCCEPSAKASCCGNDTQAGCGCQ